MSLIFIAIAFLVVVGLAIAHYLDWISKKAAASINLGGGLVIAFCAIAAFFVTNQQTGTGNSNVVVESSAQPAGTVIKVPEARTVEPKAGSISNKELAKPRSDSGMVFEDATKELFDGQLRVSLYGTKYEGDPPRWTFYGQVAGPGLKPLAIKGASPGFNVKYGNYEITILGVDGGDATLTAMDRQ